MERIDKNTNASSKFITGFRTSLQAEKKALSLVRYVIKQDNTRLNASIVSKIERLQKDLAVENNIMDKLAAKTEKAKVLSVKLHSTIKRLDDLESKRIVIKSSVF